MATPPFGVPVLLSWPPGTAWVAHAVPFQYRMTGSVLLTVLMVQMLVRLDPNMIPGPWVWPDPLPPIWVQTPELESRDQTAPVVVRTTIFPWMTVEAVV